MSRRIHILTLVLVLALLLCEINLTVTDNSYRHISDLLSASGTVQDQGLSRSGSAAGTLGTPELIRGRIHNSLLGIRVQTKGRELQRLGIRLLLLFVSVLCLLSIAFRHLRFRLLLPEYAITSSTILYFIHRKDGKK
ncbi:MAG: hypothetical protein Q4A65_02460 [Bacillota bacterium]|nr:hypothetical protein [Bacillota bacterium]